MEKQIKDLVLAMGADVCGIANIDRFSEAPQGFHPRDIFAECKSVLVFGIALPKSVKQSEQRMIYGHANDRSILETDHLAFRVAKEIEKNYNAYAMPVPSDGPYEYWDKEKLEGRGLISVKHAAVHAGIGALGKSTLLLNEAYGTLLTIGVVLTDIDLKSDPYAKSICIENCNLCIKNCPSKALNGDGVNQAKCRAYTYGSNERGFEVVNCNQCRMNCPMVYGVHSKSNESTISERCIVE